MRDSAVCAMGPYVASGVVDDGCKHVDRTRYKGPSKGAK